MPREAQAQAQIPLGNPVTTIGSFPTVAQAVPARGTAEFDLRRGG